MTKSTTLLSHLWTSALYIFPLLSIAFFLTDPMGSRGLIFVAALFWLAGMATLMIQWKKIGRIHKAISIILLITIALVGVPNW